MFVTFVVLYIVSNRLHEFGLSVSDWPLHRLIFSRAQWSVGYFQDNFHDHPLNGFQESFQDHSLFVQTTPHGCILLSLCIDDMIVTGDDTASIADTQRYLHRQFQMKDIGHLRYFLELEIAQAEQEFLFPSRNTHLILLMLLYLQTQRHHIL